NYKHLDGATVFASVGLPSYQPRTAGQAREALREAAALAISGNTVGLHIPIDIMNGQANAADTGGLVSPIVDSLVEPPAESIALAAHVLGRSDNILVVGGAGAYRSGARSLIVELADRTGALLGTSLYAKGLFEGHPFNIGLVGGFGSAAAREV